MDIDTKIILVAIASLVIAYLFGRLQGRTKQEIPTDLIDLYKGVQDLPSRVLHTIQGSINPQKGKMAELLIYAELRYEYDRIIPLGWPIDFIGVKNNDRIDFIEVKSGSSLLTEEEKHIKTLVANGRVNFRLIKVTEDEISQFVSAHTKEVRA
jgi:hypothetical protein